LIRNVASSPLSLRPLTDQMRLRQRVAISSLGQWHEQLSGFTTAQSGIFRGRGGC
jgi:hypothetical protein